MKAFGSTRPFFAFFFFFLAYKLELRVTASWSTKDAPIEGGLTIERLIEPSRPAGLLKLAPVAFGLGGLNMLIIGGFSGVGYCTLWSPVLMLGFAAAWLVRIEVRLAVMF